MIKIQAFLGNNDVMDISEALKAIEIGGLTVNKVRGRGKRPPPEIHAQKGSATFQPQFSQKYVIEIPFHVGKLQHKSRWCPSQFQQLSSFLTL